jgi:trans-aconitate methyltransferase
MVRGAKGENGWLRLEYTDHFKVLKNFIDELDIENMADIGCGAGELGRVYSNLKYVGYDLPHVIEKVSKVVNPNLEYVHFNTNDFNFSKFNQYDLLVCNSFISELINPFEVLNKIVKNTNRYLIIHRQFITNETNFSTYNTYGNLKTTRSHLSHKELNSLLIEHKIVRQETNIWGDTILFKKIF